MLMNKIKRFAIVLIGTYFLALITVYAQSEEQDATLESNFRVLRENSETFQQYKVIPIVSLNSFEKQLSDTLQAYKTKVSEANNAKNTAFKKADSLKSEMTDLQAELDETQLLVDGIMFLGMPMQKSSYTIMVWSIIFVLLAGVIFIYVLFLNSNRVTKQTRIGKNRVDNELEELRKAAHEKQVKIKRELQTALNKLEEQNR
jgi:peptidoglycan hydrolase CwlO-like protein